MLFSPFSNAFVIFDAAKHVHAGRSERVGRRLNAFRAEMLDEDIRGEIAARRDHRLAQLPIRQLLADVRIHSGVGVDVRLERVWLPSTMLWNSFVTGTGSSSCQRAGVACRNSSIITGTFIVLAAWNSMSGSNEQLVLPVERAERDRDVGATSLDDENDGPPCARELSNGGMTISVDGELLAHHDPQGGNRARQRGAERPSRHRRVNLVSIRGILTPSHVIVWHLGPMRLRLPLLLVAALFTTGCFQMTTTIKVAADGSGTIEQRQLITAAGIAQLGQASMSAGGRRFDPLSEESARSAASRLGDGVTYVSSTPIADATGQGRAITYTFTDINGVRVGFDAPAPGLVPGQDGQGVSFALTTLENGHALLRITVPQGLFAEGGGSLPPPEQIALARSFLAGARVSIAVEPAGAIVEASSPLWMETASRCSRSTSISC